MASANLRGTDVHTEHPVSERSGRILRTGLALLSVQGITWASSLVSILVIPRFLGASTLGAYSTIYTAASLISLGAAFGSANEVVKRVARDREGAANVIAHTLAIRLGLWALATLLCLAVAIAVRPGATTMLAFVLILLGGGLVQVVSAFHSALQGNQSMGRVAAFGAVLGIGGQAATILALALNTGIVGLAVVGLITSAAGTTVAGILVLHHLRGPVHWSRNTARSLVSSSLPFLAGEAALAVYGSIDFLLLAALTNSSTVGNYSLAYRLSAIPVFASTIVVSAVYPSLAESAGRDDAWFRRVVTSGTRLVLLVTLPMSAGLMALAPEIIHLVAGGEEFQNAVPALALLAIYVPAASVHTILGTSLFARDRQRVVAAIAWLSALFNPLCNLAAIPIAVHFWDNGAIGAAAVMAPTELVSGFLVWRAVGKDVDRQALMSTGVRAALACLLMAVAVRLVVGPAGLFVAVPTGVLVYGLLCLQFRLISLRDLVRFRTAIAPRLTVAPES